MQSIYLVLDESGAKGFSNKKERIDGEFGLIAGYFVRSKKLDQVRDDFSDIQARFLFSGKNHITDLESEYQTALRSAIFDYMKERQIDVIYEAAYVEGLHSAVARQNEISDRAMKDRADSNIKIAFREERERLLSVAFGMLFGRAAAYAVDYFGKKTKIHIIIDRTDETLIKEFHKCVKEFLDAGKTKNCAVRGFDVERKVPYKEEFQISVSGNDMEKAMSDFAGIEYDICCEDSSLTFAADVLSNSVFRHLTKAIRQIPGQDLNTKNIISGHPLQHDFWAMSDGKTFDSLTDSMYAHPDRRKR